MTRCGHCNLVRGEFITKKREKEWHRASFKLPPPSWPNSDSWKSDKSHQLMGPSLLEERVTNSSLIEVSESLIPYDFIVTSLGGNDSNDIWLHFFPLMLPLEDKKSICLNIPQLPLTILQPCPLPCSTLTSKTLQILHFHFHYNNTVFLGQKTLQILHFHFH